MKSLGIKDHWNGIFSDILNYLKKDYPKIMFERVFYDKSLILSIPDEYSMYFVKEDLLNNFGYDYNITVLDDTYENRYILINKTNEYFDENNSSDDILSSLNS